MRGAFHAIRGRFRLATVHPQRRFKLKLEQLEVHLAPATDVLSFHNDIGSTGLNATETVLTPANVVVNTFGKLATVPVDGQVYAQPLVKTGVTIVNGPNTLPGMAGTHDVVFVATQHDSLYAIDASADGGAILWKRNFLDVDVFENNTLGATDINPVPNGVTGSFDISPEVGITGTPVIDGVTGVLYVVVKTHEVIGGNDHYVQRLHAIDVGDGTDRVMPYLIGDTTNGNTNNTQIYVYGTGDGSITDTYNGTGSKVVQFNALREHQRAALSLVNDSVYVAWASHGDNGPYHGMVARWDVSNLETTGMVLSGVLNTSPNDGLSGIWQAGGKLAFEPDGSAFYFETGNGSGGAPTLNATGFPADGNYNNALVKVVDDAATSPTSQNKNGWGMKVSDYFIPFNTNALDGADSDFGSGGPIILPDSAGIPGHPHLLIAGGKEGKLYLVDRDNMGRFDANNDNVINSVPDGSGHNSPPGVINGLLSTPAWFNGKLYAQGGYNGSAVAFRINSNGTLSATSQTTIDSFGYLPGSPVVSSDGTSNGIVWIMDRQLNRIRAYDAATLSTELWNSGQRVGGGDNVGAVMKFAVPTVANGMVYVGTNDSLVMYGLVLPPDSVPNAPSLSATPVSGTAVRLNWTDSTVSPNTATSYLIEKSTDGTNFSTAGTAPAGATTIAIGGLQPLTHYYFRTHGANSLGDSSLSNVAEATTTDQVAQIDYSSGFEDISGLTLNGSAHLNGTKLELTDEVTGAQAGSAFYTEPVDITSWTSQFTFQIGAGADIADGMTFTIQRVGPTALGNIGGSLGYEGIDTSIALKFDIFDNEGEGSNSTGLYLNGSFPFDIGSIDLTPFGINLRSGHVFRVDLEYDGTSLFVDITDTQTSAIFTHAFPVDIPAIVGDNSAFVGFTGGTGGIRATQDVLTWTYTPTATTSPNAPSGLGATPASATSVQLSWTNNATNQIGYHLDRATDIGFTQEVVQRTLSAIPVSYIDTATGLVPGGTYFYRLRAFNSIGDSGNSNVAQVTIPLAPPKPTNQQVNAVSVTAIALSWQDNAGHDADGYKILRATNHGVFTQVATLPTTSRTPPSTYEWTDTNLTPGDFYEYHIVAYNVSGNNDFAGTNATTITAAPNNVAAVGSSNEIVLSWNAPNGAQSFNIYRGTSAGGEDLTPLVSEFVGKTYIDSAVTLGVTYFYKITAINANIDRDPVLPSESVVSSEVSATVIATPAAPTGLTASAEFNRATPQIALTWEAPHGADSFKLYRSTSSNSGWSLLASDLSDLEYLDTAVLFGRTYYYQVTAVNEQGEGAASVQVDAQPTFHAHVNFTNTSGEAVPGYLADTGTIYGDQGNGLAYGWSREDTANAYDRDAATSPNELQDSFHDMFVPGSGRASWKIALPNGTYSVRVVLGDPSDTTSKYRLRVGSVAVVGQATVLAPWIEKTVTVSVTNGRLTLSSPAGAQRTKINAIDITRLAPTLTTFTLRGKEGARVVINGTRLNGATSVLFNGLPATFKQISNGQIVAFVPIGATTGPIYVSTPGGSVVTTKAFLVAPRIASFTPSAAPGDVVTITGVNFNGTTKILINGLSAEFVVDSDSQVSVTVPTKGKTGRIKIFSPGGMVTSVANLIVA